MKDKQTKSPAVPVNVGWLKCFGQQDGHKLFFSPSTKDIAIADCSIRDPDDPASTDDGLLIVDRNKPILLDKGGFIVPLIDNKGQPTQTHTSQRCAEFLTKRLGLTLEPFTPDGKTPSTSHVARKGIAQNPAFLEPEAPPPTPPPFTVEIPLFVLRAMRIFVSVDETRFVMTGLNIQTSPAGDLLVVGTDGRLMGMYNCGPASDRLTGVDKCDIVIPVAWISRLQVKGQPTSVPITVDGKRWHAEQKDEGWTGNLIEGNFPNFYNVIPDTDDTPLISEFSLNPEYLAKFGRALKIMDCKEHAIRVRSSKPVEHADCCPTGPTVITFREENFFGLLMPMRVDGDLLRPAWVKKLKPTPPAPPAPAEPIAVEAPGADFKPKNA